MLVLLSAAKDLLLRFYDEQEKRVFLCAYEDRRGKKEMI